MMLFLLQACKNRYTLVIATDIAVTKMLKNTVTYCYPGYVKEVNHERKYFMRFM